MTNNIGIETETGTYQLYYSCNENLKQFAEAYAAEKQRQQKPVGEVVMVKEPE